MSKFITALLSLSLMIGLSSASAEVISITDPRYQVPNDESGVVRPTQGMSMQTVEQRFGQPEQKISAVGEPPISRWIYPDFVVFFEHNLVIHSVVPREQP